MKKLLAVSALGILAVSAFADDSSTPLTVRLGLAFPTNGTVKDAVSEFTAIGFQYKVADLSGTESYSKSGEISIDFYSRGDYRHIPVLYNYVGTSKKGDSFWSIGAGVGFIGLPSGAGTESIARLSYALGAGINLSSGQTASFIEAKFFGSQKSEVNALGFYLGVRF
ncbi:MAG: hypothetical protein WCK51_14415 [Armatimonadota bacterium]